MAPLTPSRPYGGWPSPIDAALAAALDGRPEYVGTIGPEVWWTEPRPEEEGRRTLVRRPADGRPERPVLPAPWNVRSRVTEYGGRPWAGVERHSGGPLLVFVHFADQRLYAYEPDAPGAPAPRPLTPVGTVGGGLRWADPVLRGDEVWCVLEEFTGPAPTDVRRVLAAVPLDGSAAEDRHAVRELTDDRHRFTTGPRLSPDGRTVARLVWDHPRMPWDGTELLLAEVTATGTIGAPRTVLGGPDEAVAQVEWAPDGTLLAVSDRGGWWNPYRVDPHSGEAVNLCPREEEFGGPLWKPGLSWLAPLLDGLVAVLHGQGSSVLGVLDPESGDLVDAAGPWTSWQPTLAVSDSRVFGVAASPRSGYEVVELDTATGHARVIGARAADPVDPSYYPEPQSRTFTGPDDREIHAHVYPPHHPDRPAPADELPPYVVWVHGGPTDHVPPVLDLHIAYFTSRGIGVVEVNYGGSSGYGRAYRERLREQWGVVDVEDCAAVARALAAEGTADPDRLAIRGGSAGGWTAAASLAATDLYACAAIIYPVLDLRGFAAETHDLESRYIDGLAGPPQTLDLISRERSPVARADRITAPFVLLQGLDDPICPPAQAERLLAALRGRAVPHAYVTFEGEGHGFRRADTMVRALEAELSLYAQVFGIERTDVPRLPLEP
ncbi:prolyl oligopeptidase family serine peptidase [Streptomyces sp. NBC_00513]|uniref:S9 family peptidase n=1 Tax=unclassified Streptomyces TaxID=2593676 RepID=UPI0022592DED|nr:prolyl oligopeptidase family serine peptidase [Streptomyces sp. NBC_00424]MCX5072548.1 prolyl oligopeptidase family serine peptidase [Streptomyces sp. NBC_00424]WUD44130.1 prolyl oligopeptidase family serine peptidase [Streptomyces sp. NBC_00513]